MKKEESSEDGLYHYMSSWHKESQNNVVLPAMVFSVVMMLFVPTESQLKTLLYSTCAVSAIIAIILGHFMVKTMRWYVAKELFEIYETLRSAVNMLCCNRKWWRSTDFTNNVIVRQFSRVKRNQHDA